ncbi:MAG: sigma-70 family RNA polymerase sigma factor [Bacteroidetes bacterium]|nr:sigma-70 family RNA polymerase sigma factor [Bacteroidota bacterium]
MTEQYNIAGNTYREAGEWADLTTLVKECIAQSRIAQKKFYDKYSPLIYAIIRRYEYNEHSACEILNDVFLKIFTKLEQYSFEGSIEGWMRRITINTVTDHIRKYAKDKQVVSSELQDHNAYIDSGAVQGMAYKELVELIHGLPEMQKAVFNLHVFESLPHKEIGTLLNITENNSRWYLNMARKNLKEKITLLTK